ncbi:hypothetical protein GSI_00800 [Ganoderma sinense ZZ0214-1]|uniref:Uncharacterized protein n=1 Tax=Ganoderma sinense ZZ0214-1 TaxID=1077348 RepID=A0A2G8SU59_9APHY|nr:hypothetical protein GSI_00800 [Ganoderma sinense ZZ0214-1]
MDVPDTPRLRVFSERRPAKSLRQRLDTDPFQEPSPQDPVAFAVDLGEAYFPTQHDQVAPRTHSRSASVLSSVRGRPEDDISSIMMRGATDLRNAKFEVEELRREIAFLQARVDSVVKEKDDLVQRLKAVKDAAKQSLQASSKSLEALRTALDDLKTRSEESFGVTRDIRTSLTDVQDLRNSVTETMNRIQPYLEPNEGWAKSTEVKNLMNALELECSRSQQVADLLRDRLQSTGGELVEAKSRILELETAQAHDLAALGRANDTIRGTMEELSSLAICLKNQREEQYEALAAAAEAEAKLASAQEKIEELGGNIRQKDTELILLHTAQTENVRLNEIIAEKDRYIITLRELQPELERLKDVISKEEARSAGLTVLSSEKESQVLALTARTAVLEAENTDMKVKVQDLRSQLDAIDAGRQATSNENKRLRTEKQVLEDKVHNLESTLTSARQELDICLQKLQKANMHCQALEERFEDQSVTLRLTRESAGDAQERLLGAESTYAKALAETTAKLELEISILREQKLGSQATMDVLNASLKRQEASTLAMQEEHANRLKQQELAFAARLEIEDKRLVQLTNDLKDARSRIALADDRNQSLEVEIQGLREQLNQARLPSPESEAELGRLRTRISTLENAEMESIVRAKTLDARYRVGDLSEEEKTFIATLIKTSQTIHEQELVANRNELRRRDNVLKEMRSKVHLLETTLAKHLSEKAKPAPEPAADHSMIDPASWMSSGQSSSPLQAPDRDGQQRTNVDIPIPVRSTPKSNQGERHATPSNDAFALVAPARDLVGESPSAKETRKTSAVPSVARQNKPRFGRLATDCSDEILGFDDEISTVQKATPPSFLSKRKKSDSPPKPVGEPMAPRPYKRLVEVRRAEDPDGGSEDDSGRLEEVTPAEWFQEQGSEATLNLAITRSYLA